MALDLNALWDFGRPEVSEQRFRDALQSATGDQALILRTQIARTYGLIELSLNGDITTGWLVSNTRR